jgi:hypothetical protein
MVAAYPRNNDPTLKQEEAVLQNKSRHDNHFQPFGFADFP